MHKEGPVKVATFRERSSREEQGLMDLDIATAQESVGQGIPLFSVRV